MPAETPPTGDLRDRMAEAILVFFGHDGVGRTESSERMAKGIADAALAVVTPELEQRCSCDGDPIECSHEAARGQADAEVERLRGELANRDSLLEKYRETVGVIVGQREDAKAERDALKAAVAGVANVIRLVHRIMACSSQDWSLHADDAWLYALLVGWDCELPEHADGTHDEIDCSGPNHLEDFAERFGWTEGGIANLRAQRRIIAALDAPETAPQTLTETDLITAYATHLRNAGVRLAAAEATIERVRALCGRGPGEHNEHQIWIADVLAALDAPSGADSPASGRTGVPRHADATHEAGEAQEATE